MRNSFLVLSAFVALFSGLSVGLASCDEVDRVTDCQDICGRYADCFDSAYDVNACRNRCDEAASDSENFDQKVDTCENCLDDRSCASATFGCATECSGIVP